MRRSALFIPLLLMTAASGAVQTGQPLGVSAAAPIRALPTAEIDGALADWRRLRSREGWPFADYARFLANNPGWPAENALRTAAEKAMRPGESAASVIQFFASTAPISGNGHARLAEALAASGRPGDAVAAAREAWASADLSATDEALISARFLGQFSPADHDRRVDALLFAKKPAEAQRAMTFASPARRSAFAARIAMLTGAPGAEAAWQSVAGQASSDAGLLMDRARYLRDRGNELSARQLLARPHQLVHRPENAERWYEMLVILARGAAADRQWQTAYDIARQIDDAFPAGTDIRLKSYGVRDEYTNLAWLAGRAALQQLSRPADAATMFEKYSRGGRSLQVESKGLYWAGRAATAAGQLAQGAAFFERAAANPDLFYGQLAIERLGRTLPAPGGLPSLQVTDAQRVAFAGKRLVRAVRLLGQQGRRDEQTLFVRALSEALDSESDRIQAVELASQIGRQDLAVWTARSARNSGNSFFVRQAYPLLSGGVASPRLWAISHGITRQESSFDRNAVSGAGARGMMQLMPPTAREQAGKLGMTYDFGRLTSDPAYNAMLGSAYFQRLLDQWGGNYPLAVASYNAGAGNVRRWVNANGDPRLGSTDVLRWIEDIPFGETRDYVQRVLENTTVYDRINPAQGGGARRLSAYLGRSQVG